MKGRSMIEGTQAHKDALNLNKQGYENLPDGKEKSSAFQQNTDAMDDSPMKGKLKFLKTVAQRLFKKKDKTKDKLQKIKVKYDKDHPQKIKTKTKLIYHGS